MQKETKLALAAVMNSHMFMPKQAETDDLKMFVIGNLEDYFAAGTSLNDYNKDVVLADIAAQSPDQIRLELMAMGFAMRLGGGAYSILNGDEWGAYVDQTAEE